MLEREYKIHFNTYKKEFPVNKNPIGVTMHNASHYNLLTQKKNTKNPKKQKSPTLTNYACIGITIVEQILNPCTQIILSPEEFKNQIQSHLETHQRSSPMSHDFILTKPASRPPPITIPLPTQPQPTNNNNQINGMHINAIINSKFSTQKPKQGAQAIKKQYLYECNA
jgi:hypothetical protein